MFINKIRNKKNFFAANILIGIFMLSGVAFAGTTIDNPLGDVKDIPVFISKFLSFVVKIGSMFSVLALIYAGFLYVKARGNPGEITKAHTTLRNTIIGIILLLGAQLIATLITGTIEAVTSI